MKFTSLQLKQIIKEEINNLLNEAEEKSPEEKALSLKQQSALKKTAEKLDNIRGIEIIKDYYFNIRADYLKKDPITNKPRHIKGALATGTRGLPFEINYDATTEQYKVDIADLSSEGKDALKTLKDLASQALKSGVELQDVGTSVLVSKSKIGGERTPDWEGGEIDPSKTGKIPGVAGKWTSLPYFSGKDKWSRTK